MKYIISHFFGAVQESFLYFFGAEINLHKLHLLHVSAGLG